LEGQKRLHESKRSNFDEESIPCPNELWIIDNFYGFFFRGIDWGQE
jgi:hypothetical protein